MHRLVADRNRIREEIRRLKLQIAQGDPLQADTEGRIRSLKKELVDKHFYVCFKGTQPRSETLCTECNVEMTLYGNDEYLTCPRCSRSKLAPCGMCVAPTDLSEERPRASSQYRKVGYLDKQNDLLECKPWVNVPQKVIDILRSEEKNLLDQNIRNHPPTIIRDWLKKHKLKDFYNNVPQLYCMLTGTEPIKLSRELKAKQKTIFLQFQAVWKESFPQETNLSSYSTYIGKIYEYLGHPEYAGYFPKTKHEKIYRNAEKRWEYIAYKIGLTDKPVSKPRLEYYSKQKKKPKRSQLMVF